MPMEAIPSEIWPVPSMIDDALSATGAPVFAASLFLFSDQGVGLCVCLHHNAVDATGFTEIVRLWARSFSDPGFEFSNPPQGRLERLSKALSTYPEEISSLLSKDLFALHPKYSKVLPAMPTEFPSCTSKLFKVSIHRINVLNETLCNYMPMHLPQVYCSAHSSGRLLPECEPTAIQLSQAKRVD
ncbi:hypothetical protein AARAC_007652 [Aspergillus arachidicola]|uniref:Transferase family-domain-containing protein n=1 Tax=Aspergillus arachidicola TaxID=656916 RepID=A0A2G7FJ21_9EURO|nr:hypothetical protein AARAC_007652 [Aspergillus arachidicola]